MWRRKVSDRLAVCSKPVITLFLGEKPEYHEENFYHAYTLDEAARLAVSLVRGVYRRKKERLMQMLPYSIKRRSIKPSKRTIPAELSQMRRPC